MVMCLYLGMKVHLSFYPSFKLTRQPYLSSPNFYSSIYGAVIRLKSLAGAQDKLTLPLGTLMLLHDSIEAGSGSVWESLSVWCVHLLVSIHVGTS